MYKLTSQTTSWSIHKWEYILWVKSQKWKITSCIPENLPQKKKKVILKITEQLKVTLKEWACVEREVGGGIGMGNTCKSMADSCQCMTKPTTIL